MAYVVRTTLRAEQDLHSIFLYIQADSSPAANKWFNGLVDAIQTLAQHPLRSPKIPENRNLRHLLYGNKPHIYRILYSVDLHTQTVTIIHIRHHARKPI
jgi:toxin ParE1/3/4